MDSLIRLVNLLGREAYSQWTRSRSQPPTQEDIETVVFLCQEHGVEWVRAQIALDPVAKQEVEKTGWVETEEETAEQVGGGSDSPPNTPVN
jgi:hypothetical protein